MNVTIPDRLFFRISDVADIVKEKPFVLRYWETEFAILSPRKSKSGQRVYTRNDVENLLLIKHLLHTERYTTEGARKKINQLRKDGELKDFKKIEVLGVESNRINREKIKKLAESVRDFRDFLQATPADQMDAVQNADNVLD